MCRQRLEASGYHVVVRWRVRGTHKGEGLGLPPTNREVEFRGMTWMTFKDGVIVEVEEQVALDSLPAEGKEGLEGKAGSGKIVRVESLTKHGKLVAYEAKVQANGKNREIQVGPEGRALDHEE